MPYAPSETAQLKNSVNIYQYGEELANAK